MSDHRDDLALARRLEKGDERGFDDFFARFFPGLFRFACARTAGDQDAAEEVAQAAMCAAVAKIGTYRGEAALFTWLCAFCRRELHARHERGARHGVVRLVEDDVEVRAALESLAAGDEPPQGRIERGELARLVRAALDALPQRYGDVLELKYLDGLPVDTIAARLGLGLKACESLLTRARGAFRDAFSTLTGGQTDLWSPRHG